MKTSCLSGADGHRVAKKSPGAVAKSITSEVMERAQERG